MSPSAMTPPQNKPTLVFVHIPKTAGTTLNSLLASHYPADAAFEIMMRGMSLRLPRRFSIFRPLISRSRISRLKQVLRQPYPPGLIHGHFDMSISKHLPKNADYVTILRDPVERVISHYYHYRRQNGDPAQDLAMKSTLKEWVSHCGLPEMDNGQTRRLAGAMTLPIGKVTPHTLSKAKANLDKFSIVGITERFDEFVALLHRHMHWEYSGYSTQNVGHNRVKAHQIDPETLQAIENQNRFDLMLYKYVSERFEKALGNAEPAHEIPRPGSAQDAAG